MFPHITENCGNLHTNDGDGLSDSDAVELADGIDAAVANGIAAEYLNARDAALNAMPDEQCLLCTGTGIRTDPVGLRYGQNTVLIEKLTHPRRGQRGWCNGCDGVGQQRPFATTYHLELDDLRDFCAFLRASGGFEIW